jgi:hypothetical protein
MSDGNSSAPTNGATAAGHLLFVWKPTGYELLERGGEPPAPGTAIEEGDARLVVTKIGASPLPGDTRPCAYLTEA